jgi:hypothetical protein
VHWEDKGGNVISLSFPPLSDDLDLGGGVSTPALSLLIQGCIKLVPSLSRLAFSHWGHASPLALLHP